MSLWGKKSMTHQEILEQSDPNSNIFPEAIWSRGDKDEKEAVALLRKEVVTAEQVMFERGAGSASASSGVGAGRKAAGPIRHTPPASSHPTDADVSAAEEGLTRQQRKRRRRKARESQNVIESDCEEEETAVGVSSSAAGRGRGAAPLGPRRANGVARASHTSVSGLWQSGWNRSLRPIGSGPVTSPTGLAPTTLAARRAAELTAVGLMF